MCMIYFLSQRFFSNVNLPESQNSGMMLFLLDLEGVACSGGSARQTRRSQSREIVMEVVKCNGVSRCVLEVARGAIGEG